MADNERFVLLDARGMMMHSYLGGTDPEAMTAPGQKPVPSVAYGIDRMLSYFPIFDGVPPRKIIAVLDAGNEYRKLLWPGYKAKRAERNAKMKEEEPLLARGFDDMDASTRELFDALGITQVSVAGVEADDVIAFLCHKLPGCFVYTLDQDLIQLQGDLPGVQVILGNETVGAAHQFSKCPVPVPVNLIRLYKSIVGDDSDEYPGVAGLGPKRFATLLETYGTDGMEQLDQIVREGDWRTLSDINNIAGDTLITALYEAREVWALQYMLASLNPALCEGTRNREVVRLKWRRRVPSEQKLVALGERIGLRTLAARFKQWLPTQTLLCNDDVGEAAVYRMIDLATEGPVVAFDFESYDKLKHQPFKEAVKSRGGDYVDVLSQVPTGVSFAYGDNYQHVVYLSCGHRDTANFDQGSIAWVLQQMAEQVPLVAHNAPFEYTLALTQLGLDLPTPYDTRLMAAHLDEEEEKHLKGLSKRWLDYTQTTYKEVLGDAEDMRGLSGQEVLSYGCDDSLVTAHLFDLFWLMLMTEGTWAFVRDEEFLFVHEQVRGFVNGVRGNMDVIARLDAEATESISTNMAALRNELREHCGAINEDGAIRLYNEYEGYERAVFSETWDGSQESLAQLEEKLDAAWLKILDSTKYEDHVVVEVAPAKELVMTPATLSKVAVKLGLPLVTAVTRKGLTAWAQEASEAVEIEAEAGLHNHIIDQRNRFINLLGEAAAFLKKREGEEYKRLVDLCTEYLGETKAKTEARGDELNTGSPQQMQALLYGKLNLPIHARSKVDPGSTRQRLGLEGSPSTAAIAVEYAVARDVEPGDWRYNSLMAFAAVKKATTAKSLFYTPLPKWVHPVDGRIHPQITNCGTETRRPSGSSPNFLQLTKKDDGKLRGFVEPLEDDHVIITADWSGQEVRIMAGESEDPALLEAYLGDDPKDVHCITGAAIAPTFFSLYQFRQEHGLSDEWAATTDVSYEEFFEALHDKELSGVMKPIRRSAKAVLFLLQYGGGYGKLARNLLIREEVAKGLLDRTLARYARIKPWQQETIEFARSHGYTQSAFGNRRHAPDGLFSHDDSKRSAIERQLVNAVIQGGAADMLKIAMASAHRERLFSDTGASMIAPVYDEVASSVPLKSAWEYCQRLKPMMEITYPGRTPVPMVVEFSVSAVSWGSVIEIGSDITEDKLMAALEESRKKANAQS